MEFWVARDKDGGLFLFTCKPILVINKFFMEPSGFKGLELDCKAIPEVTFENSPQKVILELVKEE